MRFIVAFVLSVSWIFGMEPLVSAEWLNNDKNNNNLVIIDISGDSLYQKGHIPNALSSDISKWRVAKDEHLLLQTPETIEQHLQSLGVNKTSDIVVYSHHADSKDILKPTYVIWAIKAMGHKNVALLDGGQKSWQEAGYALSYDKPNVSKGDFKAVLNHNMVADIEYIRSHIGKARMIDARNEHFYFGSKLQPELLKAGHIPKATNYFWQYSLDENGKIKPASELRAMLVGGLKLDPKKTVVTYCTGGLETSMNWFVLHNLLQFEDVKLYDASMKEWANRTDTPMSKYKWE